MRRVLRGANAWSGRALVAFFSPPRWDCNSLTSGGEPRLVSNGLLQRNGLRRRRTRDVRSRVGHRQCSSHPYRHNKIRHCGGTSQFSAQGIKGWRDACLHTTDQRRHEVDMSVRASSVLGLRPRTMKPRAPPARSDIREPYRIENSPSSLTILDVLLIASGRSTRINRRRR